MPGMEGARPVAGLQFPVGCAEAETCPKVEMGFIGHAEFDLAAAFPEEEAEDEVGLYTNELHDCVAFCILYRAPQRASWTRASMTHIQGGANFQSVDWQDMLGGMADEAGSRFAGILAATAFSTTFGSFLESLATAQSLVPGDPGRIPIPDDNTYIYIGNIDAMSFGVDRNGNAGETNVPPNGPMPLAPVPVG